MPRGALRVSASVAFGTLHIAPTLATLLSRYPEISIDLSITDRWIDLAEERYDVLIRVSSEPPLHWVARTLAPVRTARGRADTRRGDAALEAVPA